MRKKKYSLIELNRLVGGYELDDAKERELILCIVALQQRGFRIGETVSLFGRNYLLGIRGFMSGSILLEMVNYENFGYAHLSEVPIKKIKKNNEFEFMCAEKVLRHKLNMLELKYIDRTKPKFTSMVKQELVDEKDKQLANLQDAYDNLNKQNDLLIKANVDLVRENKNKTTTTLSKKKNQSK